MNELFLVSQQIIILDMIKSAFIMDKFKLIFA